MVGEAITNVAKATFLDVLLDGVERLLFRNFHLSVRPARHLDDHVQDTIVVVREERDIMERRDNASIVLGVYAMF